MMLRERLWIRGQNCSEFLILEEQKWRLLPKMVSQRPMNFPELSLKKKELKFSFSGLKTSLLYKIKSWSDEEIYRAKPDLCASFQQAVVDQLVRKARHVIDKGEFKSFGLSGGVANNELLRYEFTKLCEDKSLQFLAAHKKHTGDNAAMIGFAAFADSGVLANNVDQSLSFDPSLRLV